MTTRRYLLIVILFVPLGARGQFVSPAEIPTERKSAFVSVLLSAVVPGLGEAYSGRFDAGRYFVASEAMLWGGYTGLSIYAADYRSDMENYAIANASASPSRRGDDVYFASVGQYQSADLYNEQAIREGRMDALVRTPGEQWQWQTKDEQKYFNKLRVRSQTLDNDKQFVLSAVVLNHLLSAIDAYIVTRNQNRLVDEHGKDQGLLLDVGVRAGTSQEVKGGTVVMAVRF